MQVAAVVPVSFADPTPCLALHELAGMPLLAHVLDRAALVARLATLCVVTTPAPADDPIEAFCTARGVAMLRRGEADELARVLAALKAIDAKACVILRPHAPLIDPAMIDHVVNLVEMTDGMLDYVGTDLSPTYPRGMEVEAFTRAALEDADRRCLDPAERACAGLFLRRNSRLYRLLGVKAPDAAMRPELRLDISEEADFPRLETIVAHFGGRRDYSLAEIIAFIDQLS